MELIEFDSRVRSLVDSSAPLVRLDTGFTFTEGPVYLDKAYYFTDFLVNKIFRYENGETELIDDNSMYTIGMTYDPVGKRILRCARDARAITDFSGKTVVGKYQDLPINGGNDIIVDSKGSIFFTDPLTRKIEGPQVGHSSVFMYDGTKEGADLLDSSLVFPNGLALSVDESILYIVDTNACSLFKMDLTTKKLNHFITLDKKAGEGLPDGFRLDKEGNLYVTGPGGIWLIDPEGSILGLIKMPEVAANLCFDETGLFITASTSIYRVDTKIPPAVSVPGAL